MSYQDNNLKSLKYKIYSVPEYKKYVLKVEKPETIKACRFASRKYEKIVKELETYDCQYHLNIYPDDMLKLNIDIDGMKKDLIVKFYDDINDYFKYIGISEKVKNSFTYNPNGKKNVETNTQGYIYSHITFTNICATSSKQKEFWEGFINKYPQYKDICGFVYQIKQKKENQIHNTK